MKPRLLFRLLPGLVSLGCWGCGDKNDPSARIRELQEEVRALRVELDAAAEREAGERRERERIESDTALEIAGLERRLDQANARVEVLKDLRREDSSRPPSPVVPMIEVENAAEETAARAEEADAAPSPDEAPAAVKVSSVHAVFIIEGDQSQGTGFIVRRDGKLYLYTAAHVLSGNTRLSVTDNAGRKFTKFGHLEAAEGIDLVRLEVLEDHPGPVLRIAEENGFSVGTDVVVLGNGGGGGVVAAENGKVLGLSGNSIEIDAGVIQGNSGGPVLVHPGGEVIGLVTHLTAKRDDIWSEGTRFGDVRRFACRLDRAWEWTPVPLSAFLAEARRIADYDRMTRIGFAISSLDPMADGLRLDQQLSDRDTVLSILSEAEDVPIVAQLIEMNTQLSSRRMRHSDADLRRRFRSMLSTALSEVNRGGAGFDPAKLSWFHRKSAEDSIEWRKKANEALKSRMDSLSG